MEGTGQAVQRLERLLGEGRAGADEALHLVKDLLVKGPCGPELDPWRNAFQVLLENLLKPALTGDAEKQAVVDRLLRRVLRAGPLEVTAIRQEAGRMVPWMGALSGRRREPPLAEDLPATLASRLLVALAFLGEGEEWVGEAVAPLQDALSRDPPWAGIVALLARVASTEAWADPPHDREREALRTLSLELAGGFATSLAGLGRADQEMARTVAELQGQSGPEDLEKLRRLLLREAHAFQQHTRSLRQGLEGGQEEIGRVRGRLEAMDAELLQSRRQRFLDPVTGLPNRLAYSGQFRRLQARHEHLGESFCLTVLQLENFHGILGRIGRHGEGQFLTQVAERLQGVLEADLLWARLAQDRIAVLSPRATLADARRSAKQMVEVVQAEPFSVDTVVVELRLKVATVAYAQELGEEGLVAAALTELGVEVAP
ncbi:MAG: diguanylate cyclase [Magnetococcales bacterium]|nr:diguanylate cyclase [Magnetococcales bacterium]